MSIRDALSRMALPLLGAAAVTAGAALVQMSRKPAVEADSADAPRPAPAQTAFTSDRFGTVARPDRTELPEAVDASLLQRLRERGL